jgi:DNA-binding cell septation regulator SpoVG
MQVTVDRIRNVNQGALLAECSVTLHYSSGEKMMSINKVKVLTGRNGEWVKMPDERYQKDGEWKSATIVWLEPGVVKDEIEKAVLTAWQMSGNNTPQADDSPSDDDVPW